MSTLAHNLVPDIDESEPWPDAPAPTHAARATYRAIVADVAARAKAILPESINGRLEGAVKLVLAHDVTPQEDGSIVVGSCSNPLKTYRLMGTTCECKDFTDGKAPEGWCRHRLAAGIAKRVEQVLAQQCPPTAPITADSAVIPDAPIANILESTTLPEAPASVNFRCMVGAYEMQFTLRDADEGRLLARLQALLARQDIGPVPMKPTFRTEALSLVHFYR